MIVGRRRRYFGYPKDVDGVLDTPDSAKSYASNISPARTPISAQRKCAILPDKQLPRRYADKHLHAAIATQIPSLLPPLKNTFRFKDYNENPMKFHSPHLQNHFERSLYYIWLAKNDRTELCQIVDAHLGSRGTKGRRYQHMSGEYRDIGNPIQRPPPVDYSNMPRNMSVLDFNEPLKTKFQKGLWDPPKTPRDRFVQDHGKSPALDAICQAYHGNQKRRVTEKDIQDCLFAAKRLLGPYAGLNANLGSQDEIPDEIMEIIAENNRVGKAEEDKKKLDGIAKRPFGYNSNQIKYDKQIIAAMNYYNQTKLGANQVAPPDEIFGNLNIYKGKNVGKSHGRMLEMAEKHAFLRSVTFSSTVNTNTSTSKNKIKLDSSISKRKFDKANVGEEDYMDMYLHYLGSEEDVSIKKPIRQMTDVTKLRKKMHLDPDSEDDTEAQIAELLRTDSFSDIKDPNARKLLKGEITLQNPSDLEGEEGEIIREILGSRYDRLKDKKMKEMFSHFSLKSLSRTTSANFSVVSSPPVSNTDLLIDDDARGGGSGEQDEDEAIDDDKFEKEMGFLTEEKADDVISEAMVIPSVRDSVIDVSLVSSSDTDADSSQNAADVELMPNGEGCNMMDLDCLSEQGALGTPPFGKKPGDEKRVLVNYDDEVNPTNVFSRSHWKNGENFNETTVKVSLK